MGDRYYLDLDCAYCGELNKEIWFAPTCDSFDFNCIKCKKLNFINEEFKAIKGTNIKEKDIRAIFDMTTMGGHTEEAIKKICKDMFKEFKKRLK